MGVVGTSSIFRDEEVFGIVEMAIIRALRECKHRETQRDKGSTWNHRERDRETERYRETEIYRERERQRQRDIENIYRDNRRDRQTERDRETELSYEETEKANEEQLPTGDS